MDGPFIGSYPIRWLWLPGLPPRQSEALLAGISWCLFHCHNYNGFSRRMKGPKNNVYIGTVTYDIDPTIDLTLKAIEVNGRQAPCRVSYVCWRDETTVDGHMEEELGHRSTSYPLTVALCQPKGRRLHASHEDLRNWTVSAAERDGHTHPGLGLFTPARDSDGQRGCRLGLKKLSSVHSRHVCSSLAPRPQPVYTGHYERRPSSNGHISYAIDLTLTSFPSSFLLRSGHFCGDTPTTLNNTLLLTPCQVTPAPPMGTAEPVPVISTYPIRAVSMWSANTLAKRVQGMKRRDVSGVQRQARGICPQCPPQ